MIESGDRLKEFLETLTRMAGGETQLQVPISPRKDTLDAIGVGINMLAAELLYTTVHRDHLRSLFDAVLDLLVIVDREGTIVQVNQAVIDSAGKTADCWKGNPWTHLFDGGPEKFEAFSAELFEGKRLADLIWSLRREDGELIPVSVSASALGSDEDGCHIVLVAKDMRATYELLQRRAEAEAERARSVMFQHARDLAQEASTAKSVFLANVSHELRTPLTVILNSSELSLHKGATEVIREKCIERVRTAALRLNLLVSDLLDSSRIETGKLSIRLEGIPLAPLLADLTSAHEATARTKGLRFLVVEQAPMVRSIMTDPLRFRQVLDNLIGNAIKFTQQGEVALNVRSTESVVFFEVLDSGIGISRTQHDSLFQPFSQADSRIAGKFGGTGLGLALSRNLARLMGGELALEWSEEGRGSRFVFRIPRETADPRRRPLPELSQEGPS